jgi:hypothetical protein
MDKVQKHNSFNTNTPSSESYKNYIEMVYMLSDTAEGERFCFILSVGVTVICKQRCAMLYEWEKCEGKVNF